MKPAIAWKLCILVFLMLAVPLALAQKQTGPKYDLANEVKIKGTVEEVKTVGTVEPKDTHLVLRTDKGLVEICLCPAKFLADMDMSFAKGDKLEVTGAKSKEGTEGTEVILAREIVRGENTLVLRDKTGGPVWTWMMK
jgi:hypothetical protein